MSAVIGPSSTTSLPDLGARIKEGHASVIDGKKRVVLRAIEVGGLLKEAKERVPHGQWLSWLTENCEIPERTAQRYMELADNKKQIEDFLRAKSATLADLTLSEASRLLESS